MYQVSEEIIFWNILDTLSVDMKYCFKFLAYRQSEIEVWYLISGLLTMPLMQLNFVNLHDIVLFSLLLPRELTFSTSWRSYILKVIYKQRNIHASNFISSLYFHTFFIIRKIKFSNISLLVEFEHALLLINKRINGIQIKLYVNIIFAFLIWKRNVFSLHLSYDSIERKTPRQWESIIYSFTIFRMIHFKQ